MRNYLYYQIEVETMYSLFYLKKEYRTITDVIKATEMISWTKYGDCVVRVCAFNNDICYARSEALELQVNINVA